MQCVAIEENLEEGGGEVPEAKIQGGNHLLAQRMIERQIKLSISLNFHETLSKFTFIRSS